ncbi:flagellar hook protein FlgK [Steroidobacter agaridevorans]|uniref:Flagellar hook-associated protein 1 n=1 Tax=Steroidobacter agaridevorans TaxID=2695856 RepID=A0A829YNH0_9GAMM|nr:flagellar hook-associated protein FlgK [Steroidobacter agaridevorans]GFE84790.1 flagellar hook protein FlgK [Steroidobacter agaridevorans]GFE86313.1 flagellar hook protein FlgK [Steroidobacter agaridevorans]
MADLLNTSISGLLAFQRALDVTSHNITNANTPGYSRQLPDFQTRTPQFLGGNWVGSGADVSTVNRAYDNFLSSQARSASSAYYQSNTYATQAARISNLFGDSTTGLSAAMQKFVNSLQAVSDSPNSTAARQTMLAEAQTLVDRLKSYDSSLKSLDTQVNASISAEADTITSLARGIADLNKQIASGYAQSGQAPNDLLDQRDKLIDELSTHVNVNVTKTDDNQLNVFIGNGQPLVVGADPAKVVATSDPYDPTRKRLAVQSSVGTIDITGSIAGGSLGGLLNFRTEMLDPARNTIGKLSVALSDVMNEQHNAGMDLNGDMGGDFFAVGDVVVRSHTNNTGTAGATVTRTDAGALTNSDYILTNTAGGWSLRRADTGAVVPMTGTGTAGDPFVADGLSIVVSGAAAVGDSLKIMPTTGAVGGMKVLITDPNEIAAAAPIAAQATAGNQGNATISPGEVLNPTNPNLRTATTITFTSATTYQISGDPTVYTYTPGADIDANGWRVEINGTPVAGDSFTVRDNSNGTGDNRNMLLLAGLMNEPVMNNGQTSLSQGIGQFVGDIGVKTNQAQVTAAAQKVVSEEAQDAMQSVSGVNLDEEAANLLRYQQAYMAISQMIRVADSCFQSVLQATGG